MKKIFSFVAAIVCAASMMAEDAVVYDVPATSGSNSNYAGSCEIQVGDYTWIVEGNCTLEGDYAIGGWGLGGGKKDGLAEVDRAIYTKQALPFDVSKIEVTHNKVFDGLTINSFKLIVSDESNAAGEEVAANVEDVKTSATVAFERPEGANLTNKNYKFVYNLTAASGKNLRLEVSDIKFYGLATAIDNTTLQGKAVKRIVDGQVVIERNGIKYNALGALLAE